MGFDFHDTGYWYGGDHLPGQPFYTYGGLPAVLFNAHNIAFQALKDAFHDLDPGSDLDLFLQTKLQFSP